jgi:hypothetical protein
VAAADELAAGDEDGQRGVNQAHPFLPASWFNACMQTTTAVFLSLAAIAAASLSA